MKSIITTAGDRCQPLRTRTEACLSALNRFATVHETALYWTLAIAYKFALDALYVFAASPLYDYAGLVYAPSFIKYIVASGMYLIIFAALPMRERDAVSFLLHLQFVFTVAPMLSFYALAGGSNRYMLMVFLCVLLQIWIVCRGKEKPRAVHITGIQNYVTVMLGVLVCFTVVIPPLYNGFAGLKSFDFTYIYTMRANATYPPGFGYIQGWITNAIIPFAFLFFLKEKKYKMAVGTAAIELLIYMECGNKIVLLILVPILFIYVLARSGHLLKLLYGGFILLCIGVIFACQLDKQSGGPGVLLSSLIAVRAIFHPANNKFEFYNCFRSLPKVHFSDGLVGKMFGLTYPYGGSIGQVIYAFTGGTFLGSNTNTGYLGESYAQFGFPGMLAMSALLAVVLRGLRAYDRRETFCLLTGVFSVYFVILNDGALFTTLFSGGITVTFLLVLIYFGKQEEGSHHGIQRL